MQAFSLVSHVSGRNAGLSHTHTFRLTLALMALVMSGLFAPAQAKVTDKDLKVVFRALGFMQPKPSGTLKAAIVHDPSKSASKSEADQLQSLLKGGSSSKGMTLKPAMIKAGKTAEIANADIAFVTAGLSAHHSEIKAVARSNNVFTVSTDKSCVESGACTMFVQSTPSVQITVHSEAAEKADISFSSAFSMMIDEI